MYFARAGARAHAQARTHVHRVAFRCTSTHPPPPLRPLKRQQRSNGIESRYAMDAMYGMEWHVALHFDINCWHQGRALLATTRQRTWCHTPCPHTLVQELLRRKAATQQEHLNRLNRSLYPTEESKAAIAQEQQQQLAAHQAARAQALAMERWVLLSQGRRPNVYLGMKKSPVA